MKYCPQCNKQFTEVWLSFCPDDGTPLVHELTPSQDPNWDPNIREPKVETPSEQETQWLPRDVPLPGAWVAPDERPPMSPGVWQPPPAPYRPPIINTAALSIRCALMSVTHRGAPNDFAR